MVRPAGQETADIGKTEFVAHSFREQGDMAGHLMGTAAGSTRGSEGKCRREPVFQGESG